MENEVIRMKMRRHVRKELDKEQVEEMLELNPEYMFTEKVTELPRSEIFSDSITQENDEKNMLTLKIGQIVNLPLELAKEFFIHRHAYQFQEVNPEFTRLNPGLAREMVVDRPPVNPETTLVEEGNAEEDIEREVAKSVGRKPKK